MRRVELVAVQVMAEEADMAAGLPNKFPADLQRDPVDSSDYLDGNWAPVNEQRAANIPGFPADLQGCFLRVGPNPRFDMHGLPYHVFDGDGMVHAVNFSGGKGSLTSRWVRTKRMKADAERGYVYGDMGEMDQIAATGDMSFMSTTVDENGEHMGKSNTALVFHAGKLYSLEEADRPYEILVKPGSMSTVGRIDWWKHNFTAHPKVCPKTGEMFFFGYNVMPKGPWLHYGVLSATGELIREFPVDIPSPVMMHDMAITENFSILFDMNLQFSIRNMTEKGQTSPWNHNITIPGRFGILPRLAHSSAEIVWIEVKACSVFHFANAWEDADGTIVVIGCRADYIEINFKGDDEKQLPDKRLWLWRLDAKSGKLVEEKELGGEVGSRVNCDFPQVRQDLLCRPQRYVYCQDFGSTLLPVAALKFDLQTNTCVRHEYTHAGGMKVKAGEGVFAPREGSTEEDDGYLVCFTRGEKSAVTVLDAKTMTNTAVVELPVRVPFGFHALWLTADQVAAVSANR